MQTGAVTSGEGAADTAASRREHGLHPAAVSAWLGNAPTLPHGHSAFQRHPQRHAELRDVGSRRFFIERLPGRDAPLGSPGGASQVSRTGVDTELVAGA